MTARISDADARVVMLAAGFSPSVPYQNTNAPWPGVCLRCGHPGSPRLNDVRRGRIPCGYCAKNRVDQSIAEGKMLARDFRPSTPFPGAMKPWPGVCLRCGQPGAPTYASVGGGSGACAYCAKNKVDTSIAEGKMLALDFMPSVPYPGGKNDPWPGVCLRCGRNGSPAYGRRLGATPCGYCAGKVVDADIAEAKMLARDFRPNAPYPGSNKTPWPGVCLRCGQPGAPILNNVQKWGACRSCATHGYTPSKPGVVYVVASDRWIKVGISNVEIKRLRAHEKQGLDQVLYVWPFDNGHDAHALEQLWMERITTLPAHVRATKNDVPDGHTETVRHLKSIRRWIDANLLPLAATNREEVSA